MTRVLKLNLTASPAIWNLEKKIIKPLALRINTIELTYDPTTATPIKTYPKTKENRISTN